MVKKSCPTWYPDNLHNLAVADVNHFAVPASAILPYKREASEDWVGARMVAEGQQRQLIASTQSNTEWTDCNLRM